MSRRVFVTGVGAITPVGVGIKNSFNAMLQGTTGIVKLNREDAADFKCKLGAPMPEEVYTEEFHEKNRIKMDDFFYSVSNYILQEALEMANLNTEEIDHVSRDRVGIFISNLGEPLQNMLRLKTLRGGRLMTVTNFGITGALALEHDLHGY